jgi:hypothetical protein
MRAVWEVVVVGMSAAVAVVAVITVVAVVAVTRRVVVEAAVLT